jgi:hypothetical protein
LSSSKKSILFFAQQALTNITLIIEYGIKRIFI